MIHTLLNIRKRTYSFIFIFKQEPDFPSHYFNTRDDLSFKGYLTAERKLVLYLWTFQVNVNIIIYSKCISRLQKISKCFTLTILFNSTYQNDCFEVVLYVHPHLRSKNTKVELWQSIFLLKTIPSFYIKYGRCKSLSITMAKIHDFF